MDFANKCFICNKQLSDNVVTVSKGMQNLRSSSYDRNDGFYNLLKKLNSVVVHTECRRRYNFKRRGDRFVYPAINKKDADLLPPNIKIRRSIEKFDFAKNCFLCGKEANLEKEAKSSYHRRKRINLVHSEDVSKRILSLTENVANVLSQEIRARIVTVDLVAANARYHDNCHLNYLWNPYLQSKSKKYVPLGRPCDDKITVEMEKIFKFVDESKERHFSFFELLEVTDETVKISHETLKSRLIKQYGEEYLKFYEKNGAKTIVGFMDLEYVAMMKTWKEENIIDRDEKEYKTLADAATILRNAAYDMEANRDFYPSTDKFFEDIDYLVPKKMRYFMEELIVKHKKGTIDNKQNYVTKCQSLTHCIMSAITPKLFLSPLLLGLGVYLHRKLGSRLILDLLHNLGLCASYNEVIIYQDSLLLTSIPKVIPKVIIQFVFDNVDINIDTLDGKGTLHGMGGLMIAGAYDCLVKRGPIPRHSKPTAKDISKVECIELCTYEKVNLDSYEKLKVQNIKIPQFDDKNISNCELLWLYGKQLSLFADIMPGWNGYMISMTSGMEFEKSTIIPLPVLNAPASNNNTIYSVIKYAIKKAKEHEQSIIFITFDQPLYQKAFEIVNGMRQIPNDPQVIIRLGGFHTLMSFMGTIGYIMDGSGLREVLSTCYAELSVDKMLEGHAYARGMRGHTLVHVALCKLIFDELDLNLSDISLLQEQIKRFKTDQLDYETIEKSAPLKLINEKFLTKLIDIENRSYTSKLWIQYLRMVILLKNFDKWEKMGKIKLQLEVLKQMLPYFHASGHHYYAKSGHLYLQTMSEYIERSEKLCEESENPENTLSDKDLLKIEEYKKYILQGFWTVKRTNKYYCGTFTDMVVEQDFNRMMKTKNGSIGRGHSESIYNRLLLGLPFILGICIQLEELCKIKFTNGEQHVDARDARKKRDKQDIDKLLLFFDTHYPFPSEPKIMSIASGVTGGEEVNCHKAFERGCELMKDMFDKPFSELKFSRKSRVVTIFSANNSLKVDGELFSISPMKLFQRMSIYTESEEDLQNHLTYELAAYPTSMFIDGLMRKSTKSDLYTKFMPVNLVLENCCYTIDGGMLLHRVIWDTNSTYQQILDKYVTYVRTHFGEDVAIVFDGYDNDSNSIKAAEHDRRDKKYICGDIHFELHMKATTKQELFLSNSKNKKRLINFLRQEFDKNRDNGMYTLQALDDADVLIVQTALQRSRISDKKSVIVADDIDILVILTALAMPNDKKVYMLKLPKGKQKQKIYSSKSLDKFPCCKENILLIHAMSGCDTTSGLYRRAKKTIFNTINKKSETDEKLKEAMESFKYPHLSEEEVVKYGLQIILAIYQAPKRINSVDYLRFFQFQKGVAGKTKPNIAILPPTENAAKYHLYRVYLQVQKWLSNDLDPKKWGWKYENNSLKPIKMDKEPAPSKLLKVVFCNCKKGCGKACSCRKAGLYCTSVCGCCFENNCPNTAPIDTEEDPIEEDLTSTDETNIETNIE